MKLEYTDISEVENTLSSLKCYNCGAEIEYFSVFENIEDIYDEFGIEGLFGEDGYLTEPNQLECGTCYHFTEVPEDDFELIVEHVKELINLSQN